MANRAIGGPWVTKQLENFESDLIRSNMHAFAGVAGEAAAVAEKAAAPVIAANTATRAERLSGLTARTKAKQAATQNARGVAKGVAAQAEAQATTKTSSYGISMNRAKAAIANPESYSQMVKGPAGWAGNMAASTIGQLPFVGKHAMAGFDWVAGHGMKTGVKRGLAAYAALDVAGRVMGGGGVFKDKYGNTDIVGVPLI